MSYTAQPMTNCVLHDDGLGSLAPLTDLRAAMDIRTGVHTTFERLAADARFKLTGLVVPAHLAALSRERHTLPVNPDAMSPGTLILNARAPLPPIDAALALAPGQRLTNSVGITIACRAGTAGMADWSAAQPTSMDNIGLLDRPWDVRRHRDACIAFDLARLCTAAAPTLPHGVTHFGSHPLAIDPTAKLYPTVVLDTENGPIHIAAKAVIRPGSILIGPCSIGPGSTVLDRTLIKGNTAIGPSCKVAGEVGGTIIQAFSNKAHDGHLGDSYLGEWVNLGAGTTNSNLLNTYGDVTAKATPHGSNERTGIQFLGSIIGDHVKAAICTRLMTGTVLNTGGMFAQTAPVTGTTPQFAWSTDAGVHPFRFDKFVDVAKAAMSRRGITPSPAYITRLQELHAGPLSAAHHDASRTH